MLQERVFPCYLYLESTSSKNDVMVNGQFRMKNTGGIKNLEVFSCNHQSTKLHSLQTFQPYNIVPIKKSLSQCKHSMQSQTQISHHSTLPGLKVCTLDLQFL